MVMDIIGIYQKIFKCSIVYNISAFYLFYICFVHVCVRAYTQGDSGEKLTFWEVIILAIMRKEVLSHTDEHMFEFE